MTTEYDQQTPDRDEQAAAWCLELSEDALSAERQQAFDAWIAEPDNAVAFEKAAHVWRQVDALVDTPELISMRAEALESVRQANMLRWRKRSGARRRWWPMAAGLGAAAAIACAVAFTLMPRTQVFDTQTAQRQIATLSDGSTLSLDADSRVEVDYRQHRRDLRLVRGRARFDVAHDPLRPFAVAVDGRTVVATGTTFSVEKLSSRFQVELYQGRVSILDAARPGARANEIALTAGQAATGGPGVGDPVTVSTLTGDAGPDWRQGSLVFDDEPLATAIERVERYTDMTLHASNGAETVRVTGVFRAGDVDAFVEGVTSVSPVRTVRRGRSLTFVGTGG